MLITALLIGKIGFIVGDTLIPLKLLDRGFHKESLAIIALVDFSCQLAFSWAAIRIINREHPLRPWQVGSYLKTLMSLAGMAIVASFPSDGEITSGYFWIVLLATVLSSFASTIMHVSLNAFFSTISDPAVGGTYMTLLNTFSNVGNAWPKILALASIDGFTRRICKIDPMMAFSMSGPFDDSCGTDEAMKACQKIGGTCAIITDGYYVVNWLSVMIGVLLMHLVVRRIIWKIETMPISTWRII